MHSWQKSIQWRQVIPRVLFKLSILADDRKNHAVINFVKGFPPSNFTPGYKHINNYLS